MIRRDFFLLLGLLAAWPAPAAEALDADFIAFLANEAEDVAQADNASGSQTEPGPELVAWLRDWWNPAEDNAGNRKEKSP